MLLWSLDRLDWEDWSLCYVNTGQIKNQEKLYICELKIKLVKIIILVVFDDSLINKV